MNENEQEIIPEFANFDVLDDLDDIDKAIIRYKVAGLKEVDIARKIQMSRQTVSNRLKKVKVQQAIDELQKTALQVLLDTQVDAARDLRRIIRDKNARDQDKISADREVLKGVLSDRIKVDWDTQKKIQEYLDEDDFGHIVEEEETEE